MSMSNTQFTQSALQNPLYRNTQVGPVKLVAATNQTGSYLNGQTNNGVGATFTYAAGVLTIDSVTPNLNDYILLAAQTLGYENGIYQLTTLGSASVGAVLTRRADYQNIEQIKTGFFVPVYAGSVYAGSFWTLVEPAPQAIGVPVVSGANNLVFAESASGGEGAFLVSSNNLSDVASAPTAVTNLGFSSSAAAISAATTQVGTLNQVSVTLTPTQMAAAYATPIQLIANPSASQLIVVHSATVYTASTGHTAYATGTAPIIQYGTGGTNGAHGAGTIATAAGLVAGDIDAATSQVRTLLQAASAAITGLSGNGIYFSNATGAYTGGTGTNITFTLVYEVLTATV
jgi:hypothetical protein